VLTFIGLIAWQIWKAEQYNQALDYVKIGKQYRADGYLKSAEEMYLKGVEIFSGGRKP